MIVAYIAGFQVLAYVCLSLPPIYHKKKPEEITTHPAWGIIGSPIVEEVIFRGVPLIFYWMQPAAGILMAALMSAAFVAFHNYQWLKGELVSNIVNFAWKAVIAILWTWVTFATGSIAWAIFLHSVNNTAGYVIYRVMRRRYEVE